MDRLLQILAMMMLFMQPLALKAQTTIELSSREPLLQFFPVTNAGQTSAIKSIRFKVSGLTAPLQISAPEGFEIGKTNTSFSNSLSYTPTELKDGVFQTLFLRFRPLTANKGYGGSLRFSTAGAVLERPDLSASSLPESATLDVVTWNISWFGSEYNNPVDDLLQRQHAKTVMDSLNADIYLLQEIVDTAGLGWLSRNLQNGPYEYLISPHASNASGMSSGNWRIGQKTAFLYRKGHFSNISSRGFTVNNNSTNYYNWSNGRYPFRMDADVSVDGVRKRISFITLHAKSEVGDDPTNYLRRKGAAELMHDSISNKDLNKHFLVAGDFNDDLDSTISKVAPISLTPYYPFMSDDFQFIPASYWNTQRGDNSYIGYDNVIDHVLLSSEMNHDYVPFSCIIRKDAASWVANYQSELTDHYPVMARFNLRQSTSNIITNLSTPVRIKEAIQVLQAPNTDPLIRFLSPIYGKIQLRLLGADGSLHTVKDLSGSSIGSTISIPIRQLPSGIYMLSVATPQGVQTYKILR